MSLRLSLSQGVNVKPPVATASLRPTSWPEHNWAGYSNFGISGLLLLTMLSGWMFGFFGRLILVNGAGLFSVMAFSLLAFGGPPALSPLGIYNLISLLAPIVLVAFVVNLRVKAI